MSSSNLMKTFGKGADVIGQLATDKALRRKTTTTMRTEEPPVREITALVELLSAAPNVITHDLDFVPNGAFVIQSDIVDNIVTCTATTKIDVTIDTESDCFVTLWIE